MFSDIKHQRKDTETSKQTEEEQARPAMDRADKWLWKGKNKEMRGKRRGGHSQVAAWLPIQFSPNLTRK